MRSWIVAFVCVAFSGVHAKIPHTESFGGQHPDAHIHGFTLRAIYTHRTSQGDDSAVHNHLHKHLLHFDANPHLLSLNSLNARRQLLQASLPAFRATLTSRERVLALAKLNLLAYPGARNGKFPNYYYSQEAVNLIYAKGDGIFGTSNTREGELDYMQAMWNAVKAETDAAVSGAGASYKYVGVPSETAETSIGVWALEFKRGNLVCFVFRGSTTDGDFSNIQSWLYDWILERMSGQMKKMWVDDAGLVWGDDQKRWENEGDKIATAAIRTSSIFFPSSFPQQLSDAVTAASIPDLSLSKDDAKKYGYWPISRYLADKIHREVTAAGEELLLTGHSQGGTRASLVSMYLRKKYGVSYNTVTFAATGAQCFPRKLGSGADLLADVDPYISHPQITEYAHVLDPWGQAIGLDVGKVCLFGKKDIATSKAYKYCSKVYGHPGPNLIYVNSDSVDFLKTDSDRQLAIDFRECRLFTHLMETVLQEISAPGVVLDNGDTADGCKLMDIAPKDDPNKICPTGSSWFFWLTAGGIVVIIVIILAGLVLIACLCCRRLRKSKSTTPGAVIPPAA